MLGLIFEWDENTFETLDWVHFFLPGLELLGDRVQAAVSSQLKDFVHCVWVLVSVRKHLRLVLECLRVCVRLEELHYLLSGDLLVECFFQTVASQPTHHQVGVLEVLPHKQSQDGLVQLRIRVSVHLEIRLHNYEALFLLVGLRRFGKWVASQLVGRVLVCHRRRRVWSVLTLVASRVRRRYQKWMQKLVHTKLRRHISGFLEGSEAKLVQILQNLLQERLLLRQLVPNASLSISKVEQKLQSDEQSLSTLLFTRSFQILQ